MNLSTVFGIVSAFAIPLAVDMFFVLPITHFSILGQFISGYSSAVVVPPVDYVAINWFGMENPMAGLTDAALNMPTDAIPVDNVIDIAPTNGSDIPLENPFSMNGGSQSFSAENHLTLAA